MKIETFSSWYRLKTYGSLSKISSSFVIHCFEGIKQRLGLVAYVIWDPYALVYHRVIYFSHSMGVYCGSVWSSYIAQMGLIIYGVWKFFIFKCNGIGRSIFHNPCRENTTQIPPKFCRWFLNARETASKWDHIWQEGRFSCISFHGLE